LLGEVVLRLTECDAVRAYYLVVTKDPQPGAVYNIGGAQTATVRSVLGTLISLSTYKGAVVLVTHDEGAVEALQPERILLLPDGIEDVRLQVTRLAAPVAEKPHLVAGKAVLAGNSTAPAAFRDRFGPKRKDGARPIRGLAGATKEDRLFNFRQLRTSVFG
jgi:hypothetical protein